MIPVQRGPNPPARTYARLSKASPSKKWSHARLYMASLTKSGAVYV